MAVTLQPVSENKIGVLGLGRLGSAIVNQIAASSQLDAEFSCWDCAPELEKAELIGFQITHGLSCRSQQEIGKSIFLIEQERVKSWLSNKELVIVTGSCAGGFAGGFMTELAQMAKHDGVSLIAYPVMPFAFEGRKTMDAAKLCLGRLREFSLAAATLELDDYLERIPETTPATEAIDLCVADMTHAIDTLLQLILREGLFAFNIEILKNTFNLGIDKSILLCKTAKPEEAVEDVVNALVEQADAKLPDRELTIDRLMITVLGDDNLSLSDVNQINEKISERFGNPDKSHFGACIDSRMSGLKLIVYACIGLGDQFELGAISEEKSNEAPVKTVARKASRKTKPKKRRTSRAKIKDDQGLFDIIMSESNRGYFEDTDLNLIDGEDMDVPTYLRRGLRIKT